MLDYAKKRKDEPVELKVVSTLVDADRHESFFADANQSGLEGVLNFHVVFEVMSTRESMRQAKATK